MPVDYSKWDALELSDDSDIEVHPNVDKRSFIRAKQNQIHQQRHQRKVEIETLKYERVVNDGLINRISGLLDSLRAHAVQAGDSERSPAEVAFQAVMMSAAKLDPKDDQPPPRPAGVHGSEEPMPSYTKMMATLLDQVNKALDEKKVEPEGRYAAMLDEMGEHLAKVTNLQKDLLARLAELEKEEGKKITSEGIHTGFDSSHVNKSASDVPSTSSNTHPTQMELLNPNYKIDASGKAEEITPSTVRSDDDDEVEASPLAREFASIKAASYKESLAFLTKHPQILTERETDGLLVLAFDAQLDGRDDYARNCVHQALLLQYCRALGRDGVALFFKRIGTPGHRAQGVFAQDVQDTYGRIKTRSREILRQRAIDAAEGNGDQEVEQIQLQAVEPGTQINITIPPAEEAEARAIFESFKPEMKAALATGKLDEVNKVLGKMKVDEAEDMIGKLSEAGILSVEELIDATTDEGKEHLEQLKQEAAAAEKAEASAKTSESTYADDPE